MTKEVQAAAEETGLIAQAQAEYGTIVEEVRSYEPGSRERHTDCCEWSGAALHHAVVAGYRHDPASLGQVLSSSAHRCENLRFCGCTSPGCSPSITILHLLARK